MLTAVMLLGTGISAAGMQTDGDEYTDDEQRPCQSMPGSFQADGYHQGKTFRDVEWDIIGEPKDENHAKYRGVGNIRPNLTVDVTRKWQWAYPTADFECTELYFPGPGWIRRYHATATTGSLLPYGEEEEERSETLSGGGMEDETDEWYICWYYQYPDGTRSPYYRCDPM